VRRLRTNREGHEAHEEHEGMVSFQMSFFVVIVGFVIFVDPASGVTRLLQFM
jgi:hypothetical protein